MQAHAQLPQSAFPPFTPSPNDIIYQSPQPPLRIYRWQLDEMLSNNGTTMVYTDVIDAWLALLVADANRKFHTHSTESAISDDLTEKSIPNPSPAYLVLPIPLTDLIFQPSASPSRRPSYEPIAAHLTPTQFLSATLILLPLDIAVGRPSQPGHSILVTIRPPTRTIRIYDSWRPRHRLRARMVAQRLEAFMLAFVGREAAVRGGGWVVIVESGGRNQERERRGKRWCSGCWGGWRGEWQRNGVDCGIWVCGNAWGEVMGEGDGGGWGVGGRLWRRGSGWDVGAMRRRIVRDLLRGKVLDEEMGGVGEVRAKIKMRMKSVV